MLRDYALVVIAIMNCHVILCCDDAALQRCVDAFNMFVQRFDEDSHRSKESLESQCVIMEETAKCARSILDDCHNIQEAYVGGQIDAHEYLCDNIDVYHKHQSCLRNAELQRDIEACTYTEDHYNAARTNEHLCSNANHDLDCIRSHTISQCGSTEAGNFQYTFHKKRLLPLFDLINCDLNDPSSSHGLSTGAIIGISVVAVLLVVGAAGILAYAIRTRNKNSASSRPPPTASLPTTAPDGSTALENPMYSIAQNGAVGPVSPSNGDAVNNNYPVYEELSPDKKLPPSDDHAVVVSDDMSKMSYKPDC